MNNHTTRYQYYYQDQILFKSYILHYKNSDMLNVLQLLIRKQHDDWRTVNFLSNFRTQIIVFMACC